MAGRDCSQLSRSEVAHHAREHYQLLSNLTGSWCSTILMAINAWEREPMLKAEIEQLQAHCAAMRRLIEAAITDIEMIVDDPDSAEGWRDAAFAKLDDALDPNIGTHLLQYLRKLEAVAWAAKAACTVAPEFHEDIEKLIQLENALAALEGGEHS